MLNRLITLCFDTGRPLQEKATEESFVTQVSETERERKRTRIGEGEEKGKLE